jgi:hypothetical protein
MKHHFQGSTAFTGFFQGHTPFQRIALVVDSDIKAVIQVYGAVIASGEEGDVFFNASSGSGVDVADRVATSCYRITNHDYADTAELVADLAPQFSLTSGTAVNDIGSTIDVKYRNSLHILEGLGIDPDIGDRLNPPLDSTITGSYLSWTKKYEYEMDHNPSTYWQSTMSGFTASNVAAGGGTATFQWASPARACEGVLAHVAIRGLRVPASLVVNPFAGITIDSISATPEGILGGTFLSTATLDAISETTADATLEVGTVAQGNATLDSISETTADVTLDLVAGTTTTLDSISETTADADLDIGVGTTATLDSISETTADAGLDLIRAAAIDLVASTETQAAEMALAIAAPAMTIDASTETQTARADLPGDLTCLTNRTSGRRVVLLLQDEDEWGVVAASGHVPLIMEIKSESLSNSVVWVDGRQNVSTSRAPRTGLKGRHDASGQIVGELQPHGPWPMLMRHLLTSTLPNSSGSLPAGPPYEHVLAAADELPPGFTIEKQFHYPDGFVDYWRYTGCRLNSTTVRIPSSGLIGVTADIVAKDEVRSDEPLHDTPTAVLENDPFDGFNAVISISPLSSPSEVQVATDLEWTVSNEIRRDQYTVDAGRARSGALARGRRVSGQLRMFLTDRSMEFYRSMLDEEAYHLQVNLTAPDGSTWVWHFGLIEFRGTTPQVQGPGPVALELPFISREDDVGDGDDPTEDVHLTVTNDDPMLSTVLA